MNWKHLRLWALKNVVESFAMLYPWLALNSGFTCVYLLEIWDKSSEGHHVWLDFDH